MDFLQKQSYGIEDLLSIMELLRSEGGCPWDREQTHESIRKNFIEETYEAVDAIDQRDMGLLREELGDVLLQVVFHTEMERELGTFDFGDVCDGVCKKLIHRHPHIFADVVAETPAEVLRNWDELKKREKRQATQAEVLRSVPRSLPSLMRSEKVQSRAAKVGFDYPDVAGALRDLRSEVDELCEAVGSGGREDMLEELGDVLFSAVNVSRFMGVDAEHALLRSCDKFIARFEQVERLAEQRDIDMPAAGIQELDILWREAKIQKTKTLEVLKHDEGRAD